MMLDLLALSLNREETEGRKRRGEKKQQKNKTKEGARYLHCRHFDRPK
jgi:hypothetical protein